MDSRPELYDEVASVMNTAYSPVGGHAKYSDGNDLRDEDKHSRYDMIDNDRDPHVDAAKVYSETDHGFKASLSGHDDGEGKDASKEYNEWAYKQPGVYGEASGPMANFLNRVKVPVVTDTQDIQSILGEKSHKIRDSDRGFYARNIGGEEYEKQIFGNPLINQGGQVTEEHMLSVRESLSDDSTKPFTLDIQTGEPMEISFQLLKEELDEFEQQQIAMQEAEQAAMARSRQQTQDRINAVPCPTCNAQVGEPCIGLNPNLGYPAHIKRMTLAHKGEPMEIAFQLLKERVSPEAKRHKLEYDKRYEKTPERRKYQRELHAERRKRGIYGSGDHMDVSHTEGGKLTLEPEHSNRARHFKGKGTLRQIEKSFEEIAHRINAARTHLDPEKQNVIYNRYHGEIPSMEHRGVAVEFPNRKPSDTLHPAVGQDWQPAALSALLGMVQPSAIKDYPESIHYLLRPFELGEYTDNEVDA